MKDKIADKWTPTNFGLMLDLPHDNSDIVIVAGWNNRLIPLRLLLPHQIYTETIDDLKKEYPEMKEWWVIPACSSDYRKIVLPTREKRGGER